VQDFETASLAGAVFKTADSQAFSGHSSARGETATLAEGPRCRRGVGQPPGNQNARNSARARRQGSTLDELSVVAENAQVNAQLVQVGGEPESG